MFGEGKHCVKKTPGIGQLAALMAFKKASPLFLRIRFAHAMITETRAMNYYSHYSRSEIRCSSFPTEVDCSSSGEDYNLSMHGVQQMITVHGQFI